LALRILALITDGFGAPGGIARYNQALLSALADLENVKDVLVVPRFGDAAGEQLPPHLRQLPASAGKAAYLARVLAIAMRRPPFDFLFCGHIYMAALAAGLARWLGCPWWLQLHGVDAWAPLGWPIRWAAARPDLVTSVSRYTRERFLAWADVAPDRVQVLPNVLDPRFTPGPKPMHLLRRYGLEGRRVLLTVARLSALDRYKGHDRVIRALPELRARFPDLAYVIAGDGDDRPRLEALARGQGVADIVCFVGQVAEAELVEHYRMADLFVMPSTGEGFGIVFLEALACGVPAIGGDQDGSVEALSCSPLGRAVPPEQVGQAIARVLAMSARNDQPGTLANCFGEVAFADHLAALTASFAPRTGKQNHSRHRAQFNPARRPPLPTVTRIEVAQDRVRP
jgi:phosphatidyl-myo-inositol dimannoside synthase